MLEGIVKEIGEKNGLTKMFLDYDGTLLDLTSEPELAIPDKTLLKSLRELGREVPIYLITGRDLDGILSLVGNGLNIIALHGSQFVDEKGGRWFIDDFEKYLKRTGEMLRKYSHLENDFPGLRIIDKKGGLQFHYYKVEKKERKRLERVISKIDEEGFEMYYGKYIFEFRIEGMNKGKAILRYMNREDLAFFAGDDNTDEEAFNVLKRHITIKVGKGKTAARFRLQSPAQMKKFISYLYENKETMFRKVA